MHIPLDYGDAVQGVVNHTDSILVFTKYGAVYIVRKNDISGMYYVERL